MPVRAIGRASSFGMSRLRIALVAALVGLASALPFLRSYNNGVVCIDDYTYVVEHSEINGGLSSLDVRWMFANTEHAIFMPLTWFSYAVDCEIARHLVADDAPLDDREAVRFRVMHVHSALLHSVNAALVFLFLLLLVRAETRVGVCAVIGAALFWGLHPLRVESVAWIASRKDLVSFLALALSLILWVRWRIRPNQGPIRLSPLYWLSLAFLALGALAKPSVMIFPGLILLIDFFILRKYEPLKKGRLNIAGSGIYVAPVLLGLAIAAEATAFQNVGGAMADPTPLWARVLNAFVSYGVYIKNTVWPNGLALQCLIRYPHPPRFFLPGLALFGGCIWYFYRKFEAIRRDGFTVKETDLVLAGLLWFFLSLIPFIGIVGFGYHAYADRFTYIPSIGISILVLGLLARCRANRLVHCVFLFLALGLVPLTIRQIGFWKDEETVWKRTLEIDGEDNFIARVCLGQYAFDVRHDVREAVEHFNKAYAINPDFTTGFGTVYMNALVEAGENERAFEFFKYYREWNKAFMAKIDPHARTGAIVWGENFASARVAMLMGETNSLADAEKELDVLLKSKPRNQNAHYLKGRLAEMRGDRKGALQAWKVALECVEPSDAFPRFRFLKDVLEKEDSRHGVE